MNKKSDIPSEPLDLRYSNSGFMPHIGMHHRGRLFVQESSYSHFWLGGVMLLAALLVSFLPWTTVAGLGVKLKYWIAGFLVWGGICGAVPYWLRNRFGQTITIDPVSRTLTIERHLIPLLIRLGIQVDGPSTQVISWTDILGIQVCHQRAPGDSERNGYQLNLVWRDVQDSVQRHCLLKHAIKKFVVALGTEYVSLCRFEMIDSTKSSQPTAAGYGSQARRTSTLDVRKKIIDKTYSACNSVRHEYKTDIANG